MAPYRTIARYHRCDTPYRAIPFQGGQHSPKMMRYPPFLALSFTRAHLCDTPLKKKQTRKSLRYYRYKYQRKTKGGGNSGEGKTYHKTPPQKRFWTPPLMIRFPPPLCLRNVVLLRGNGHRPDKSHFLRPPKLVLEGGLYGTFSPPPKSHDTFPLPFANSQK